MGRLGELSSAFPSFVPSVSSETDADLLFLSVGCFLVPRWFTRPTSRLRCRRYRCPRWRRGKGSRTFELSRPSFLRSIELTFCFVLRLVAWLFISSQHIFTPSRPNRTKSQARRKRKALAKAAAVEGEGEGAPVLDDVAVGGSAVASTSTTSAPAAPVEVVAVESSTVVGGGGAKKGGKKGKVKRVVSAAGAGGVGEGDVEMESPAKRRKV